MIFTAYSVTFSVYLFQFIEESVITHVFYFFIIDKKKSMNQTKKPGGLITRERRSNVAGKVALSITIFQFFCHRAKFRVVPNHSKKLNCNQKLV